MNSIARTKKRVNAGATGNESCKQRHGKPYFLCVHQALIGGAKGLLTLCNAAMRAVMCGYLSLCTVLRMPKQTDGGQHLSPPNISLSNLSIKDWHRVPCLVVDSSPSPTITFKNIYTYPTN
ncbi:hypothetical protein [Burkholderia sp. S171]|uniref:hypothetical protein n=1 Tax=Burkholderia sp. S171 TaxID=1641860 RepID=UPI001575088B|nr:hypothetical protein [Burkholderia sp. S171]